MLYYLDDIRRQGNSLVKNEFIELVDGGGKGSICKFKRLNSSLGSKSIISFLISPEELELKIRSMSIVEQDTLSHTQDLSTLF